MKTKVLALTEYAGEPVAGGAFSEADGQPAYLVARWTTDFPTGDLNCDGSVGVSDLLIFINSWGACADCDNCPADLNGDCTVGVPDLLILIANWG